MFEHDVERVHIDARQTLWGQHVDLLHRKSLPQLWRQSGQLRWAQQLNLGQCEALDLGARQAQPLGLGQGLDLLGLQGRQFVAHQGFELIHTQCGQGNSVEHHQLRCGHPPQLGRAHGQHLLQRQQAELLRAEVLQHLAVQRGPDAG